MTFSAPSFAAGLFVPNPTFSVPKRDGSGEAAGWELASGRTASGWYSSGIFPGHERVQRFSSLGTGTQNVAFSSLMEDDVLTYDTTVTVFGALHARLNGTTSANDRLRLYIQALNASGTVQSSSRIAQITGAESLEAFVLDTDVQAGLSYSSETVVAFRLTLDVFKTDTVTSVDVAFVGAGVWDNTDGYFQLARLPSFTGTFGDRADLNRDGWKRSPEGITRYVRGNFAARPHVLNFTIDGLDQTDANELSALWGVNRGYDDDLAASNPNGGAKPALVIPGNPTMPKACYADFDATLGLRPVRFAQDPPLYSTAFSMTERIL